MNLQDVIKQGNIRVSKQDGGARPNNPRKFAGLTGQHMAVQGVDIPQGDREAINVMDPRRASKFVRVGSSTSAPDSPTATLMVQERSGLGIPFVWSDLSCSFNLYLNVGNCQDLTDPLKGWTMYALVVQNAFVTGQDAGDLMGWEDDGVREHSLDIEFSSIFAIGKLMLGEGASSLASREVIDVTYGSILQCGDCGPQDNGAQRIYAVTTTSGGSPGLPAELIYSVNGGSAWSQVNITGFGAAEAPLAVDVVGGLLVVLGDDAYFLAEISATTGIPGTFSEVTTGFVGANTPRDVYALDSNNVYIVGDGGYIYKSTALRSGVSVISAGDATANNLLRVHGDGNQTIVAVGASGTVVKSANGGRTWGTVTTAPSANSLQAVAVLDDMRYWVGDASGGLFYTADGGESWTTVVLESGVAGIQDIVFLNDEVGYIAYTTAGPVARIASTWDGGVNWALSTTAGGPRLNGMPVADRVNRIAVPHDTHPTIGANHVALAGLAGDGTDGVLIVGSASIQ